MNARSFAAGFALLLPIVAVVACDDGGGTGGAGSTSVASTTKASSTATGGTPWEQYCGARTKLMCPVFDEAVCKSEEACATALIRDEVEKDLLDCFASECDPQTCFKVTEDTPTSSQGDIVQMLVADWTNNCADADAQWFNLPFYFSDAFLAKAEDCLNLMDCTTTKTCLKELEKTDLNPCEQWF